MGSNVVEGMKGSVASGGIAVPAIEPIYGNYLTTHGFEVLSYAECMQVLGSAYVAYLLVKALANTGLGRKIREKISKLFKR